VKRVSFLGITVSLLFLFSGLLLYGCDDKNDYIDEPKTEKQKEIDFDDEFEEIDTLQQKYEMLMQEMSDLSEFIFSMEVDLDMEPAFLRLLPQPEDEDDDIVYPSRIRVAGEISNEYRVK